MFIVVEERLHGSQVKFPKQARSVVLCHARLEVGKSGVAGYEVRLDSRN